MARKRKLLKFWTAFFMFLAAAAGVLSLWTKKEITVYLRPGDLLREDLEESAQKRLPPSEIEIPVRIFFDVTAMKEDLLVEGGFTSETLVENYPLGRYLLSETEEPQVVVAAVQESVERYLMLHPDSKVTLVAVTGCADGATVFPGTLYRGDLGPFRDFTFYSEDHNRLEKLTLLAGETRLDNTSIAFLRAYSALQEVSVLPCLREAEEQVRVETSPLRGGAYRRVFIRVAIQDALKDQYQRLSLPAKIRLRSQDDNHVPGLYLTE